MWTSEVQIVLTQQAAPLDPRLCIVLRTQYGFYRQTMRSLAAMALILLRLHSFKQVKMFLDFGSPY